MTWFRTHGDCRRVTVALVCAVIVCAALGGDAPVAAQSSAAGAALVVQHRCGACHVDLPRPDLVPLRTRSADTVFALLRTPAARNRHPDFRLSEAEALAVALAVTGASKPGRALQRIQRAYPAATADLGNRIANGLACGGCHEGLVAEAAAGPILTGLIAGSRAEWLRDFLLAPRAVRPFGTRPGSGSRMPDFALTPAGANSIVAYLKNRERTTPPDARRSPDVSMLRAETADALLDRLSCRGCHSYGGRGGQIGPRLDDVRARRTDAYIAAIVHDPARTRPGTPMPRVVDGRIDRVVALLTGDPRSRVTPPAMAYLSALDHPLLPASVATGNLLYASWCAACHGLAGRGDGYNAAFLQTKPAVHADSGIMSVRPDATLFDGVAAGGAALGRSPEMPPFGATLPAEGMRALVTLMRSLCRCAGPAWSRGDMP